jgi:hypothetical protein
MFSLQALKRINDTYQARRATEREAVDWLKTHQRGRALIEQALANGWGLYFIDGELVVEGALVAYYLACAGCGALVRRQQVTDSVTQWKRDEDAGESLCNACYTARAIERLNQGHGAPAFNGWPVMAGDLTPTLFWHPLDERALAQELERTGWERVWERDLDPYGRFPDGLAPQRALVLVEETMEAHPDALYIVTNVPWPTGPDYTLWRR